MNLFVLILVFVEVRLGEFAGVTYQRWYVKVLILVFVEVRLGDVIAQMRFSNTTFES